MTQRRFKYQQRSLTVLIRCIMQALTYLYLHNILYRLLWACSSFVNCFKILGLCVCMCVSLSSIFHTWLDSNIAFIPAFSGSAFSGDTLRLTTCIRRTVAVIRQCQLRLLIAESSHSSWVDRRKKTSASKNLELNRFIARYTKIFESMHGLALGYACSRGNGDHQRRP